MPKIIWKKGDFFTSESESGLRYGVALSKTLAVLVTDDSVTFRVGIEKAPIPENAHPFNMHRMHVNAQLVLRGALAAVS